MDLYGNAFLKKRAYGGLHVERIASEAINRIDVDHVSFAGIGEQTSEARALCSWNCPAHSLVCELLVELLRT